MGCKVVRISPEVFSQFFVQDRTWGQDRILHVASGIPADAKFVRAWWEEQWNTSGYLCMLYDHPAWPVNGEGEMWPIFIPILESIEIEHREAAEPA